MKDHRINRQKLHPLENIIAITIVSIICGSETWEEISFDGKIRKKFFSKFLDLKNGIPSKDTFRRFFAALDPQVFETHFIQWAQSLVKNIDKEVVSIDGKTIREASRRVEGKLFYHLTVFLLFTECPYLIFLNKKRATFDFYKTAPFL